MLLHEFVTKVDEGAARDELKKLFTYVGRTVDDSIKEWNGGEAAVSSGPGYKAVFPLTLHTTLFSACCHSFSHPLSLSHAFTLSLFSFSVYVFVSVFVFLSICLSMP